MGDGMVPVGTGGMNSQRKPFVCGYCRTPRSDGRPDCILHNAAPRLISALEAIRARIAGEYDHPALQPFGPLETVEGDCAEIARVALARAREDKWDD